MRYPEYAGMSYEQAAREAERLIKHPGWYASFGQLSELGTIMDRRADADAWRWVAQEESQDTRLGGALRLWRDCRVVEP